MGERQAKSAARLHVNGESCNGIDGGPRWGSGIGVLTQSRACDEGPWCREDKFHPNK